MNFLPPLAKQLIVASSPQIAALSVGGLNGYPTVLLSQLKGNNSSIILDLDTSSWIASMHGMGGIPSILIPTVMQWRGRRFAYIAACLISLVGWILTYCATNVATILIGESFHGFGAKSVIAVSLITISEMVGPRYRSISMVMFGISEMLGVVIVTVAGYFLNWQTVGMVMGFPIIIAILLVFVWPESPSWLACKGEFQKCEEAFIFLRGTGAEATKELTKLLDAQKESLRQLSLQKSLNESIVRNTLINLTRRDFYVPIIYFSLLTFTFYFGGTLVIYIYAVDIIADITDSSDFICVVYMDVIIVISSVLGIILAKQFNNKPILISSHFGCGIFSILASVIIYCKDFNVIPKHALLICLVAYSFCSVYGSCCLTFNLSAELIPVKHRGLCGALYVMVCCLFDSGSLKISPYLFKAIGISGTFVCFAVVSFSGLILIWKFIPETKGRTLQEIEDLYNLKSSCVQSNFEAAAKYDFDL